MSDTGQNSGGIVSSGGGSLQPSLTGSGLFVVRSAKTDGRSFSEYRKVLRFDFYYSCAYCTMTESEASAVRFVIDHYEPQVARPELVDDYDNLMYCCDECNSRKSDRVPSETALNNGMRFFRPDQDRYEEHFRLNGQRVDAKTPIGVYTKNALDLDRLSLRRIRDLRRRVGECYEYIAGGVLALNTYPIDNLPKSARWSALEAIKFVTRGANATVDSIDKVLREYAKSPLLDDDPEEETRKQERLAELKKLEVLHPGTWRGRELVAKKASRGKQSRGKMGGRHR